MPLTVRPVAAALSLALFTFSAVPAVDGASEPLTNLIQYGVLGIVVIGFVTGWIAPGPQVKQLVEENKRLNLLITDTLLPTIEKVTLVLDQNTSASKRQTEVVEEVRRELRDLGRGK